MSSLELVDISLDFQSRRHRLKRRLLRIFIPIGCVIVMIAAIAAIAGVSYVDNRNDALALSKDILESLDRRIATEIRNYLVPASNVVEIAAKILKSQIARDWLFTRVPFGTEAIKTYPQFANFNIGDPLGQFLMHKKMPDGAIHTKVIERSDNGGTSVFWIRRDINGKVVKMEEISGDTYDPRVRPWYVGAVKHRGLYWTDVYIFFSDKKPGITVSYPIYLEQDQLLGVVSLDIALERISAFLAKLEVGQNGRAMIIDENGYLIAYPVLGEMLKETGDRLTTIKLDEMDDPVLARAYNRFQIEGYGSRTLDVDRRKYINTVSSLKSTVGRNWSIMIVVPQDDFIGFVAKNSRTSLMMATGVVAMAAVMAGLLVFQGLRSDRNAQLLLERQRELESQSRAFAELASKASLFDPADQTSLENVTEVIAATLGARRVGVWHFSNDGKSFVCDDCYDRESDGHIQGTSLKYEEFPHFFDELRSGGTIAVADADGDHRTAELYRVYLHPLGSESLLAVPIIHQSQTAGAVWLEHEGRSRSWRTEEITFAGAIANMVAMRIAAQSGLDRPCFPPASYPGENQPGAIQPLSSAAGREVKSAVDNRIAGHQSRSGPAGDRLGAIAGMPASPGEWLATRTGKHGEIGAKVCAGASVMVLRWTDPIALAEKLGDSQGTLAIDHLACHIEEVAAQKGVEYMRLLNEEIICAAGLTNGSQDQASRIAELALSIQQACAHVFAGLDRRMDFRIGLDRGAVFSGSAGRRHKSHLLWGEAVGIAGMLAESGVNGGIHVSESFYRRLPTDYLYKVRGSFYLPHIGEITTYLLTGRL